MSWWVLSSDSLREMLRRVACGEDPEMVYVEYYANCEHDKLEVDADGEGEEEPA